MGTKLGEFSAKSEGFEIQMHTNQLSHVLLLSKLMPQLEACAKQTLGSVPHHMIYGIYGDDLAVPKKSHG